ncbi:M56 family metallopeptidase [Prauserella muralis]|uniref:Peptidase n=1 Tax=Prauserella muralis TaxID=588067 RepID=A0A2V4BBE4_9PSEU|nr:M56 family metallopeptidase [Prauserella muralis]PXY31369.1 peptidase [Prauserella muralis]TWE14308.1 Zn-dependent protease with chaperone function [Prauserella muralis]
MILAWHQLAAGATAVAVVAWLLRSRWTHTHPRAALVLWQITGLTLIVATIGALLGFGLAPFNRGLLPALFLLPARVGELDVWHFAAVAAGLTLAGWLVVNQVLCLRSTARARARHRLLLQLVARPAPDALEVDHPIAVAYCLPGRTPRIVVSAGARRLLTDTELDAVLAHERAHARERHHLVVAPFQALRRLLPGSALLTRVVATIELLVEMCADDRAARTHGREPLASALERFHAHGVAGTPAGALAVADTPVQARIRRLREPQRSAFPAMWPAACLVVLTALGTSASLFAVPL